jgi:hypothetical protein
MARKVLGRYAQVLELIFHDRFKEGARVVPFSRENVVQACNKLEIDVPKNLGDVIYTYRYRKPLPDSIRNAAPEGLSWIIVGEKDAHYRFELKKTANFIPSESLYAIPIPDSTPSIIAQYALTDEQAVLAKVRYNRLVDLFLRANCFSLQNHLRTKVREIGQIEIDELYIGVDRRGSQCIVPVQAKGGSDILGVVQIMQDMAFCNERFPGLVCRPVGAASLPGNRIAMFEFVKDKDEIVIIDEKHYALVPSETISVEDLERLALLS